MTDPAPRTALTDPLGAFMAHAPYGDWGDGGRPGPLSGLRLAVKDLFDVAGTRTGAGAPAWLAQARPAEADAPAVAALRAAGAEYVGKTLTDELAWSLNGENVHYGTPENPAAPGRIPGGSSAGSAAAVAGGLADIGLGTDTGGSVRLPASYCGVWGLRPTHGRISLDRVAPLGPSFDTVGGFATRPQGLAAAGAALLGPLPAPAARPRLRLAVDLFALVDAVHRDALLAAALRAVEALGAEVDEITVAPEGIDAWRAIFRTAQSADVWEAHGAWVTQAKPQFGPGIAERFAIAAALPPETVAAARAARAQVRARMEALTEGALLLVPGAPCPPPPRGLSGPVLEGIRDRALGMMCPAGLSGLPQLAFPALRTAEGPLGLGLIGPRDGDEALLALAPALSLAD